MLMLDQLNLGYFPGLQAAFETVYSWFHFDIGWCLSIE